MTQPLAQTLHASIDIGANLTHARFAKDLAQVISRAQQAHISHIVVTGTSIAESTAAIALCQQYPHYLYCTAGIHPHDASQFDAHNYEQLKQLASQPCVRAIGETGLDFNRNFSSPQQQIHAFEQQIALAIELQPPLFLHERDAHEKQLDILKYYRPQLVNAVIHCFTGDKQQCFNYLDLDLHIGVTGWICDEQRGQALRECVAAIPPHRLMIETDAPYLSPKTQPKPKLARKGRNEPCTLNYVAEAVARCSQREIDEVIQQTAATSRLFFGLGLQAKAEAKPLRT
ncbi:TatD family hydrolase [Dasania sp. GY-MA-18]|uniref:TatD family hydrolase n=1 Tax=Dasania phycosphaerae TaxID=2950436 RepID=A0A9J6RI91_9GAMM|nr:MULTISPECIES: TatD family hydrolase [Dasania]MCR8921751.1 TatD family hydrolase [Dasania sp. GY-MA-18]MCZ0864179.1 TatD family hydrolase [Dasania phycosphaerae]MCZ0867907.1 TatD family hydrolase [Dasania phycosphaerae]